MRFIITVLQFLFTKSYPIVVGNMFGFMKKNNSDDKKRKEKKDSKAKAVPLTKEQLQKLEDARKRMMSSNGSTERLSPAASDGAESTGSFSTKPSSREMTPERSSSGKAFRIPPPLQPKPKKTPARGNSLNLGGKSSLSSASSHSVDATQSSDSVPVKLAPIGSGTYKLRQSSLKKSDSNSSRGGPPRKPVTLTKPKPLQPKPQNLSLSPRHAASSGSAPEAHTRHSTSLDDSIPLPATPPSPTEKIYSNVDLQLPSLVRPLALKSATKSIEVPFIVWRHFHPRAPATKTCDVTIMAVKGTDTANFTLFIEVANGDG